MTRKELTCPKITSAAAIFLLPFCAAAAELSDRETLAETHSSPAARLESAICVNDRQTKTEIPDGVYIFFSPGCPICREYVPYLKRLSQKHSQLIFFLVFNNCDQSEIDSFVESYKTGATLKAICDRDGKIKSSLNARISPQAFLLLNGKTIYSGRIDNRYAAIGKRRSVISSYDLERSIESARSENEKAVPRKTEAVGCFIEPGEKRGTEDTQGGSK